MKTIIIILSFLLSIYIYSQNNLKDSLYVEQQILDNKPTISACEFANNYYVGTVEIIDAISNYKMKDSLPVDELSEGIIPVINCPKKMIHYKILSNLSIDGVAKLVYNLK